MERDKILRRAALAAMPLLLAAMPLAVARAASPWDVSSQVAVEGATTTWKLSLLRIHSMYQIPHTVWSKGYRSGLWRMFVLTVRLTNTGSHAADPYDDLVLTLKVMPPHQTSFPEGWEELRRLSPFIAMARTAAREYGGVPPWTMTAPGRSTTYCVVIATNRGESHYGLYNAPPGRRYVFLLDTGL